MTVRLPNVGKKRWIAGGSALALLAAVSVGQTQVGNLILLRGPMNAPGQSVQVIVPPPALRGGPVRSEPMLAIPVTTTPMGSGGTYQRPVHSHPYGARQVSRAVSYPNVQPNVRGATGLPPASQSGFRLSVDGIGIAGDGFDETAWQDRADRALAHADVQLRVDGLDVEPRLNIGLITDAGHHPRSWPLEFIAYSNYDAYIAHAEVRIFAPSGEGQADPAQTLEIGQLDQGRPRLVIPLDRSGRGGTFIPPNLPADLTYQLRVYDPYGNFDETTPKPIRVTEDPEAARPTPSDLSMGLDVYGRDATLRRNIKIRGAAVTVNADNIPQGFGAFVMGRPVPVDPKGRFVIQQILPFGAKDIDVQIADGYGGGLTFNRTVDIPKSDLFYVALGDLTIGERGAVGLVDFTDPGEDFDSVEVAGRGAFYLKGRVRGDTLITAALDTDEAPIDELFNNLDDKDPRQLLRRLDANTYYPVYGDNSTVREDAPTQGRFYVRLERDDNTLLWGNFATAVTGTELAHLDRGLYGALADYNSNRKTRFGERRSEVTVFAADPGTIPGRDEFRGTGGSLYFLQRQDITVGSERLRIEVRDPLTGLVTESRELRAFQDYEIDYLQGRILLSEPLQSTVSDGRVVRADTLSGNETYLVARYEFTPGVSNIDGYTFGGRVTQWLGDYIRIGATGQREETGAADQALMAADLWLRASDKTFLKGEIGQTVGPGFSEGRSSDGGFLFDNLDTPGFYGPPASAYRLEGQIDLGDTGMAWHGVDAQLRGTYEEQEAGYSGQGRIGFGAVTRTEVGFDAAFREKTTVSVDYTELESSDRGDRKSLYADVVQKLRRGVVLALGLRHSQQDPIAFAGQSPNAPRGVGKRTDATAELRLTPVEDTTVRVFYQDTLARDAGRAAFSRYGVGGDVQLGEKTRLSAEVSEGDGGLGATARLNVQGEEGSEYYLGYALSADNGDSLSTTPREAYATYGTITAGARRQYTDSFSVYGEEQASFGRDRTDLIHAFGVDYRPNPTWAFGASAEIGTIRDDLQGDFDREAVSLSMARTGEIIRFATNFEARFETGLLNGRNRDRTTYLMRNTLGMDLGHDFEALARFNIAQSISDESSILDSDFIEGVAAFAYRPVHHDRLNALAKYTFFEDLSPAEQGGNDAGNRRRINSRQRSHILSVDGTLDMTDRVSVGGKFAYRLGEVELDRGTNVFVDSQAWLGVARLDYHVIDKWDVFVEGRYLSATLSDDARLGALTGVHRHVGEHIKIGAGYSFSSFSDDLTDFRNDSDGWFINVVGKL